MNKKKGHGRTRTDTDAEKTTVCRLYFPVFPSCFNLIAPGNICQGREEKFSYRAQSPKQKQAQGI